MVLSIILNNLGDDYITATMQITPIPAFSDNYIWQLQSPSTNHLLLVDPGDDKAALSAIAGKGDLTAILITHHHYDHVDGVAAIKQAYPNAVVYGPDTGKIAHLIDEVVAEGSCFTPNGFDVEFNVMHLPGHTLDHLAYYNATLAILISGDVIFCGGCGRMFEGTPELYSHSLNRIAQLPAHTKIYCTHEYTLANLQFARHLEPNNLALANHQQQVMQLRANEQVSLPTDVGLELKINPFLRCLNPEIKQHLEQHFAETITDYASAFALTRRWKDKF